MKLRQTNPALDKNIQKYGCLFLSIANAADKEFTPAEINKIWLDCITKGYISGDRNGDNDLDDVNEAIILNHDAVAKALGAKLAYVPKHYAPDTRLPDGFYYIGDFYNPATKFHHFVVIDRAKQVIMDPIPNSRTVKEGKLYSIRLYKKL